MKEKREVGALDYAVVASIVELDLSLGNILNIKTGLNFKVYTHTILPQFNGGERERVGIVVYPVGWPKAAQIVLAFSKNKISRSWKFEEGDLYWIAEGKENSRLSFKELPPKEIFLNGLFKNFKEAVAFFKKKLA